MIRQCTKCGRFLRSDAVPTLREKLVELADGTRTIHDLMDATGCTRGTIYVALTQLRRQKGIPVKLKPSRRGVRLTREQFDHLTALRRQGLSWREIGQLEQIRAMTLWEQYRKAKVVYGNPEPEPIKKTRDEARDWVRMHELRADARLPWRLVGRAIGMTGQRAGEYYRRLQKVYAPYE